ncbi:hypothetical protein [Azotosporobacter soli]|uniref:hypothetical protein n=1 Tax=Azotosporobacter soli TaxID=3055040 RepID=UPI0031FF1527
MPDSASGFEKTTVDGITIYYTASLAREFKTVTIVLERFLFVKSLLASGERY